MRKGFSLSIIFLLLIALAFVVVLRKTWTALDNAHIGEIHYRLERLSLNHIHLSELSFSYRAEKTRQVFQLKNIAANWNWKNFSPQINTVDVESLTLTSELSFPLEIQQNQSKPFFNLPQDWNIPAGFPKKIHIKQLLMKQQCPAGACTFSGSVDLLAPSPTEARASIQLSPGDLLGREHQLDLTAIYTVEKNLPRITAKLTSNQGIDLELNTYLQQENEINWLGDIKGSIGISDSRWLAYLQEWNLKIVPQKNEFPSLSAQSNWALALTPLLNISPNENNGIFKKLTGHWQLEAALHAPVDVSELGKFAGKINFDVAATKGKIDRYALSADLHATNLALPQSVRATGLDINAVDLAIHSSLKDGVGLTELPVEFVGSTQGLITSKIKGITLVDILAKKIVLKNISLIANAKSIEPVTNYYFENLSLDVNVQGYFQPDSFKFTFNTPASITADINAPKILLSAKAVKLNAKKVDIAGKIENSSIVLQDLAFDSDASLSVATLSHPHLKPNHWSWTGKVQGTPNAFDLNGELMLGSLLSLKHHAALKQSALTLDWKIADLFLLAGNPFADTVSAWPSLLSLARGKFSASGDLLFDIDKTKLISSKTEVQLQGVAGIYDASVFEGLSTNFLINTTEKNLYISTNELKVNQIDRGLLVGPVVASGKYRSTWLNPLKGKLTLANFNSGFLGGSVTTSKQEFDFSRKSQGFTLDLNQLNLSTLLQQYPSSELTGSGQLSGIVPIEINSKGFRVIKGVVSAEAPGGKLKYQSERATALAKSQPGVKLITEALSDFHYSILSSEVHYDETGKLLLSVRLEGRNPTLENGRPINFNVNLEEDVPAMLASIQLSSKVTDIIKKRLQNYSKKK